MIIFLRLSLVFWVFVLGKGPRGPCLWTCSPLVLFLVLPYFFFLLSFFSFLFLNIIFLRSTRFSGQVHLSFHEFTVCSTKDNNLSLLLVAIHILITIEVQKYAFKSISVFSRWWSGFSLLIAAEKWVEINLSRFRTKCLRWEQDIWVPTEILLDSCWW